MFGNPPQPILLVKSADNCTGYKDICKGRINKRGQQLYYAKFIPEGEKKQRTLPGSVSTSARESACVLAFYKVGNHGPLPRPETRAPRRSPEVSCALELFVSRSLTTPSPLALHRRCWT